jgi:hypothetical protein
MDVFDLFEHSPRRPARRRNTSKNFLYRLIIDGNYGSIRRKAGALQRLELGMLMRLLMIGTAAFLALLGVAAAAPAPERDALLANSQISYQADGGFTGVESYGVIISCVKGHVSVLKSLCDLHASADARHLRQIGTMNSEDYLRLWANLSRQNVLALKDAPPLNCDSLDEFTTRFVFKVGNQSHHISTQAISRPEVSRYFALRSLIDRSVQMEGLWQVHKSLALNSDSENEQ